MHPRKENMSDAKPYYLTEEQFNLHAKGLLELPGRVAHEHIEIMKQQFINNYPERFKLEPVEDEPSKTEKHPKKA